MTTLLMFAFFIFLAMLGTRSLGGLLLILALAIVGGVMLA